MLSLQFRLLLHPNRKSRSNTRTGSIKTPSQVLRKIVAPVWASGLQISDALTGTRNQRCLHRRREGYHRRHEGNRSALRLRPSHLQSYCSLRPGLTWKSRCATRLASRCSKRRPTTSQETLIVYFFAFSRFRRSPWAAAILSRAAHSPSRTSAKLSLSAKHVPLKSVNLLVEALHDRVEVHLGDYMLCNPLSYSRCSPIADPHFQRLSSSRLGIFSRW